MSWWSGRRLAIALLSAIALNLFLGGMLAAVLLFQDGHRGHGRDRYAFREAALALPGESRREVREAWQRHRMDMRPRFRALGDARRRLADLLTADGPLDDAALDAAFREVRERSIAVQDGLHEVMIDIARRLPTAERKRFFGRALHHREHRGHRRR